MNVAWTRILLLLTCVAARSGFAAEPAQWPRWRGPADNGFAPAGPYPVELGPDQNVVWKIELEGHGCSTPVVWDERIYVTSESQKEDAVLAFDWSGKKLWETRLGAHRAGKHRNGSGSNPSAVVDGQRIYVYYKSGRLAALDLSGKELWQQNIHTRFGKDTLYWDLGTSPVVTAENVVIALMQHGNSTLAAFDKRTGELSWSVPRNFETPVEGDHSYATPIVVQHHGHEAILVWGAERLSLHKAIDGSTLWSCSGFNPDGRRNWVAVASFVVVGDTAVVPYGRGSRLAGIRLGGTGDVTSTHRLWTREDAGSFVPTPCSDGKQVVVVRDKGEVQAVDPRSGKTLWSGQLPKSSSKYYASPLLVGDTLYASREDGKLMVASIGEDFRILAENDMQERLVASPVALGGRLLIRGEKHLWAFERTRS